MINRTTLFFRFGYILFCFLVLVFSLTKYKDKGKEKKKVVLIDHTTPPTLLNIMNIHIYIYASFYGHMSSV